MGSSRQIPNPDEIYHKASKGRLQNTDNEADSYDTIHIISMAVEGTPEFERQQDEWRREQAKSLSDKLPTISGFAIFALIALVVANRIYGQFTPLPGYFLYAVGTLYIIYLFYYVIRQLKLSHDSKKYKKARRKQLQEEAEELKNKQNNNNPPKF